MDKNRRKLIHCFCGLFRVREKTTGHLVKYIYDTEKQRGNICGLFKTSQILILHYMMPGVSDIKYMYNPGPGTVKPLFIAL